MTLDEFPVMPVNNGQETSHLMDILDQSALTTQERRLAPADVSRALAEHYGLSGPLKRIDTEKDDTFVLTPDSIAAGSEHPDAAGSSGHGTQAARLLVKISSSSEAPQVVDLQSAVLDHVKETDSLLPVPRLVPTVDGHTAVPCFEGTGPYKRILRVLSYLEGEPLGIRATTSRQRNDVGRLLASLSLALSTFSHPSQDRLLVWDLQNFPHLEPLLAHVRDRDLRTEIERQFALFRDQVSPRLPEARFHVVHNDLNRYNVLVGKRVAAGGRASPQGELSGIIDFGDVVRTAVPFDLAIAASGHLTAASPHPWGQACDVFRGYLGNRALNDAELEIAVWAAPARIALRALLICYQSAINPQRGEYLNSHVVDNLAILQAVSRVPTNSIVQELSRGVAP